MPIYRRENTEEGKLNVYIWVKAGPAAAPAPTPGPAATMPTGTTAQTKPANERDYGARPMHIVWDHLVGLAIDANAPMRGTAAGGGFTIHQMPPNTRHEDALTWIEREGRQWANGQPAQLVVVSIKGVADNGLPTQ